MIPTLREAVETLRDDLIVAERTMREPTTSGAYALLVVTTARERLDAILAAYPDAPEPGTPPRCAPDPFCLCCECQGRMCIMPHPGHAHRQCDWAMNRIEFAGRGDRTEPASKATTESVGLEVSDPLAGDFVTGHGQQSSALPPPASRREETPKTLRQFCPGKHGGTSREPPSTNRKWSTDRS